MAGVAQNRPCGFHFSGLMPHSNIGCGGHYSPSPRYTFPWVTYPTNNIVNLVIVPSETSMSGSSPDFRSPRVVHVWAETQAARILARLEGYQFEMETPGLSFPYHLCREGAAHSMGFPARWLYVSPQVVLNRGRSTYLIRSIKPRLNPPTHRIRAPR